MILGSQNRFVYISLIHGLGNKLKINSRFTTDTCIPLVQYKPVSAYSLAFQISCVVFQLPSACRSRMFRYLEVEYKVSLLLLE